MQLLFARDQLGLPRTAAPLEHDILRTAVRVFCLGETVAVLIILRAASSPSTLSLFDGGFTFASKIASGSAEFNHPLSTGAYIAAGLVLFILTFIVNLIARSVSGGKVNG